MTRTTILMTTNQGMTYQILMMKNSTRHVDDHDISELMLSLHDDADVNDDDEDDDGDDDFDDEESRHDVSKFKSELNDDVDDNDNQYEN